MTINEDTGEEPVCPVCDAADYWSCGHLVASIARSFWECRGGAFQDHESRVSTVTEAAFLSHIQNGSEPQFTGSEAFDELWGEARANYKPGDDDVELDGDIYQRFVIELLESAGAFETHEPLIEEGGPGMSSAMTLLFAEDAPKVVDQALEQLKREIGGTK